MKPRQERKKPSAQMDSHRSQERAALAKREHCRDRAAKPIFVAANFSSRSTSLQQAEISDQVRDLLCRKVSQQKIRHHRLLLWGHLLDIRRRNAD